MGPLANGGWGAQMLAFERNKYNPLDAEPDTDDPIEKVRRCYHPATLSLQHCHCQCHYSTLSCQGGPSSCHGLLYIVSRLPRAAAQYVHVLKHECCCTPRLGLTRTGPGKYVLGATLKPLMLRSIGKNVMIRIGGGWDNFRAFMLEHDPCRKNQALQAAKAYYDELQRQLDADRRIAPNVNGHVALFTTRDVEP